MTFTTNHELGDIVYLKTDKDQLARMITAVKICGDKGVYFTLSQGIQETCHYEIEFSTEKDILFSVT